MAEASKKLAQAGDADDLGQGVAPRALPENVELRTHRSQSMSSDDNPDLDGHPSYACPSDDTTHSDRCGYGRWRPDCLQILNRPGVLVAFLAAYSFVLGFLVNGVHNVNISSIERRFSLSSTRMGLVSSFFDISGSTVALLIGYFGSGKKKPRLLAITTFISALGSLTMSSPHFLSDSYTLGAATDQMLCQAFPSTVGKSSMAASAVHMSLLSEPMRLIGKNSEPAFLISSQGVGNQTHGSENGSLKKFSSPVYCRENTKTLDDSEMLVFCILAVSQLLHGVGGTALFTVGASLLDDSVKAQRTPLFLGFVYGANIIGSGIGYFVGGQLLRIYVDVDIFSGESNAPPGLTDSDTRWVGAWWMGPFLAGVLQLLLCLPLTLYGYELPQAKKVRKNRVSQAHSTPASSSVPSTLRPSCSRDSLCQLVKLSLHILRNPCFTFVTLGMTTEAMFVSGSAAFLPKVVENQFNINASMAAFVTGLTVMPAAIFGLMFGGYLAKRFKFTIQDILKFTITFCTLGGIGTSVLWIRCDPTDIFGVNRAYDNNNSSQVAQPLKLTHPCNSACNCDTNFYEPLCSEDAGTFFSPCFAGCRSKSGNEYFDCSCVNPNGVQSNDTSFKGGHLSSGNCRQSCDLLWIFATLLFFSMSATFMPIAPCDSVQLRCVLEEHKLYAQGIKTLVIRLLGSFCGPIMMGRLVDSSCWIWRDKCGERLSCWIYDGGKLVLAGYLFALSCKVGTVFFMTLALYFYIPPSSAPFGGREEFRAVAREETPNNERAASIMDSQRSLPISLLIRVSIKTPIRTPSTSVSFMDGLTENMLRPDESRGGLRMDPASSNSINERF